jgi:hypothetical protein
MSHYTQILARTDRPTQVLGGLKHLDVYFFPHTRAGMVICERASEVLDVRIIIQVSRGISWNLGRGPAVLAIAGDEGTGFWCGLFEGGEFRFQHNRLTGPRDFAEKPASHAEIDLLCGYLGGNVSREAVHGILTSRQAMNAVDRHAALAQALGLPAWSPGVGYSKVVEGRVPPEAGTPKQPPSSVRALRPIEELSEDVDLEDSLARFHYVCGRAFNFLEEELGFRKEPTDLSIDHFPRTIGTTFLIGAGNLRPGYKNAYILCYRSRHVVVVIEGLSFGSRTRLCLIDQWSRHLDLTGLVERRDPELFDLCRLAHDQSEQIPLFAEALRKCASDVLAGDLSSISCIKEQKPGFSFSAFFSEADGDYILSLYGPRQ